MENNKRSKICRNFQTQTIYENDLESQFNANKKQMNISSAQFELQIFKN